jgi:hypothetical protein
MGGALRKDSCGFRLGGTGQRGAPGRLGADVPWRHIRVTVGNSTRQNEPCCARAGA